jgi:hypothetical protein
LPRLDPADPGRRPAVQYTRLETLWIIWGALKAALLIAGIMSAVMIGFVALLRFVWRV